MVELVALRSFAGLEGRVRKGTRFLASEHRAAYLMQKELAELAPGARPPIGPSRTQDTAPTRTTAPAPAEATPVGGGWYEVAGLRYRGKAAAEAALREATRDDGRSGPT